MTDTSPDTATGGTSNTLLSAIGGRSDITSLGSTENPDIRLRPAVTPVRLDILVRPR